MTSADDKNGHVAEPGLLAVDMLVGALLFGVLGALASLIGDESWLTSVGGGAVAGLLIGVGWYRNSRRAAAYRSSFDLADRTLTRPTQMVDVAPRPELARARRYRNRPALVISVAMLAAYVAFAIFVSKPADAGSDGDPATTAFVWSLIALPIFMLVGALLTYVDVGPGGLRVRNALRVHRVGWVELAEVRWHRTTQHDLLLLVTTDGRDVKAQAVFITDTGQGARRAAQVLEHIKQAWSESG